MGTDVTEQKSGVPALRYSPADQITAEDVRLPKLKVGQGLTGAVSEGKVKFGDFFTELSADDPDPITLAGPDEGVIFYVIGLRKGKSKNVDGNLETWQFDDPDAPEDAWTTYSYTVVLPEVDEVLPYSFLLSRSSKSAAQQINTIIKVNAATRPPYEIPFRATAVKRKNTKGTFYVVQVGQATVSDEDRAKHQAVISEMVSMLGEQPVEATPAEAPAI